MKNKWKSGGWKDGILLEEKNVGDNIYDDIYLLTTMDTAMDYRESIQSPVDNLVVQIKNQMETTLPMED